jgi:hypothetical protein
LGFHSALLGSTSMSNVCFSFPYNNPQQAKYIFVRSFKQYGVSIVIEPKVFKPCKHP